MVSKAIISREATKLSEVIDALEIFRADIEQEGYQHTGNIEEWKAVSFVRRLPAYLSLFCVIQRDIERIVDNLDMLNAEGVRDE